MTWSYHQKPKRWESILPHGYFIVIEEDDEGNDVYVVYKGSFGDWQGVVGASKQIQKMAVYAALKDAKKHNP